jgi:hypothetical protein
MEETNPAVARAQATHRLNKAVEHMIGIVTGIIADTELQRRLEVAAGQHYQTVPVGHKNAG